MFHFQICLQSLGRNSYQLGNHDVPSEDGRSKMDRMDYKLSGQELRKFPANNIYTELAIQVFHEGNGHLVRNEFMSTHRGGYLVDPKVKGCVRPCPPIPNVSDGLGTDAIFQSKLRAFASDLELRRAKTRVEA